MPSEQTTPSRAELIAKWEKEAEFANAGVASFAYELGPDEVRAIADAVRDAERYADIRNALIQERWQQACEIKQDAKGRWKVRFGHWFLRQSAGPKAGTFWDTYGDDFQSEAWAVIAVSNAPTPRSLQSREAIDAATLADGTTPYTEDR